MECPSISPDGTRIAFKLKTSAGSATDEPTWQPAVLDLSTLKDHPVAETRTVDDQIEWLDNSTVAYAIDTGIGAPSIYSVPADGTGAPALLVPDADSPSVSRKRQLAKRREGRIGAARERARRRCDQSPVRKAPSSLPAGASAQHARVTNA